MKNYLLLDEPCLTLNIFPLHFHNLENKSWRELAGHPHSVSRHYSNLASSICRPDTCGFWKVMEIDNAIFLDLESFGKERFFKMAMEKFWIFIWRNSEMSSNGYNSLPY